MTGTEEDCEAWQRFEIRRIEDLGNAILGAGLTAVQMTGPPVRGSLAFAARDGVIFSSGRVEGNVLLAGRMAPDTTTVLLCLEAGRRTRLGTLPASAGCAAAITPEAPFDAYLGTGTLYIAATLDAGRLLDPVPAVVPGAPASLRDRVRALHDGPECRAAIAEDALVVMCRAFAGSTVSTSETGAAGIVRRARAYIEGNLGSPIAADALAAAIGVPRRTLYRAFAEVLGDTPNGFIRRLRLHVVRQRLLLASPPACTVRAAARPLRLDTDMGRLSLRYRELFGELPSATLARQRLGPSDAFL